MAPRDLQVQMETVDSVTAQESNLGSNLYELQHLGGRNEIQGAARGGKMLI